VSREPAAECRSSLHQDAGQSQHILRVAHSAYGLGYGLDDSGLVPGRGNDGIFFSSPLRPVHSGAHPASSECLGSSSRG
jgi:hypothetical protein